MKKQLLLLMKSDRMPFNTFGRRWKELNHLHLLC